MEEQLKRVNDKLQQLLRQYRLLQKDNERLNNAVKEYHDKEKVQAQQIDELTTRVQVLTLAAGQMDEADKKEFEKKINRYIKQVDKCINYLGE
jgi:poly-D-alanine transfer protein DltD